MKKARSGKGFSLVELLVVLTAITLLLILGFAAQQRAIAAGRNTRCVGNLRQIAALMQSYLADHRYTYPLCAYREKTTDPFTIWVKDVVDHSGNPSSLASFICPAVTQIPDDLRNLRGAHAYVSYGINRYGVSPASSEVPWLHPAVQTRIEEPSRLMMMMEFEADVQPWDGWYQSDQSALDRNWSHLVRRHRVVNALYCDGHVAPVTKEQLLAVPFTEYPWGGYKNTLYR